MGWKCKFVNCHVDLEGESYHRHPDVEIRTGRASVRCVSQAPLAGAERLWQWQGRESQEAPVHRTLVVELAIRISMVGE